MQNVCTLSAHSKHTCKKCTNILTPCYAEVKTLCFGEKHPKAIKTKGEEQQHSSSQV